MSHHPVNASQAVTTFNTVGCFSTRLYINKEDVQNTSSESYTVSASFTNPAVGSSVTLSISNAPGTSFRVGSHVVIGTRVAILRTPSVIGTGSTYDIIRMGGYDSGTDLTGITMYMCDPDNSDNVTTCTTPDSSLGNARIGETQVFTVPVGNLSKVPTNSFVTLGDHTGTYVVTAVTSTTSITVRKIAEGDIPSGVSITSSPRISTGKLLAVIPRNPVLMQFVPTEAWYCCISNSNTSVNTPLVGIGWNANYVSARGAFTDNMGWGGSSTTYGVPKGANSIVAGQYGLLKDISTTSQSLRRQAVPAGHALMAVVNTSTTITSMDYVLDIFVRGFYSRIPTLTSTGIVGT